MIVVEEFNCTKVAFSQSHEKQIHPEQNIIISKAGHGKTSNLEFIIYQALKNGFVVIIVGDIKGLLELAYGIFPTELMGKIQSKALKYEKQNPIPSKIKLFHPFSFDIPSHKIPQRRIFTMPLSWMDESIIRFKLENQEDIVTKELLLNTLSNRKSNEGIVDVLNNFEKDTIRRTRKTTSSQEIKEPDPNNWALLSVASGNQTNVDTIGRIFKTHYTNLWWMQDNFKYNLDIENELFKNQEEIKFIDTHYIKKKKDKTEIILTITNQIVEKSDKCNHKIMLVYDEVRGLIPAGYRKGYIHVVADEFSKHLNINFRNRNISSWMTSQSLSGISKSLLRNNVFTKVILGAIDGQTDLDNLKQIYGFNSEKIINITQLEYMRFIIFGLKDLSVSDQLDDPFVSPLPPFVHKEPFHRSFDYYFKKYFPDKLESYESIKKEMKHYLNNEINRFINLKIEKTKKDEKQENDKTKEKVKEEGFKEKITQLREKVKLTNKEQKQSTYDEIYKLHKQGDMTQTEIASQFDMNQSKVSRIIKKIEGDDKNGKSQEVDGEDKKEDESKGS